MGEVLTKVDRTGECWVWTGYRQPNGYAKARHQGRVEWVHRIAWMEANGPIAAGLMVCHKCDNPPCVRPDHLFLGTAADNARDRNEKGRTAKGDASGPRRRAKPLTCPSGHPRSAYRWDSKGHGICPTCHAQRQNARYHASRLAVAS